MYHTLLQIEKVNLNTQRTLLKKMKGKTNGLLIGK